MDQINLWTENQQMILSENKTKSMILNFTKNFQFITLLQLKQKNVEIVDKIKILGTIVNNQLSWNENCSNLIKKANARMQLLRKVWSFGSTRTEMVGLWKVFCRGILEQTCPVWSSSLTDQNKSDLERVQKTFVKLILEEDYTNYQSGLSLLHLNTLEERRNILTLRFAKTSLADGLLRDLFPLRSKQHRMTKRNTEKFKVTRAYTERFRKSPIITMQNMLNRE